MARRPLCLVAVLAATALSPAPAFGHAAFVASTPDPGARLDDPPAALTLGFTEPLNRQLSTAIPRPPAAAIASNQIVVLPIPASPSISRVWGPSGARSSTRRTAWISIPRPSIADDDTGTRYPPGRAMLTLATTAECLCSR